MPSSLSRSSECTARLESCSQESSAPFTTLANRTARRSSSKPCLSPALRVQWRSEPPNRPRLRLCLVRKRHSETPLVRPPLLRGFAQGTPRIADGLYDPPASVGSRTGTEHRLCTSRLRQSRGRSRPTCCYRASGSGFLG